MPFVFKFSTILLILAAFSSMLWQFDSLNESANIDAKSWRAECPSMGGPKKIQTKGDVVRFYDAYYRRAIGGTLGLHNGCSGN